MRMDSIICKEEIVTVTVENSSSQKASRAKTRSKAKLKNKKRPLRKIVLKDFICDYEGRHFNTKDKLRLHIYQHRLYFRVKCAVCDKEYRTNQSLRKHLRTHYEQHQCDTCGQTFKHMRLLQNHVSAIHKNDPTIPCKYCTRLFPNNTVRDLHQNKIHKDKQINTTFFKCTECPLGFEMREELRIHSFIHFNGEIHTCLECNQIFKRKRLLQYHMQKHDKPNFECKVCKQMFKYRSNLGKHQKLGRCKGIVEVPCKQLPEEEAEIAKQQLIDITVNPTRVNISAIKDYPVIRVKELRSNSEITVLPANDQAVPQEKEIKTRLIEELKLKDECFEILDVVVEEMPSIQDLNQQITNSSHAKRLYQRKNPNAVIKRPSLLYECDLCGFEARRKIEMVSHIRQHVRVMRHKCKTCSEFFSTRMLLHTHSLKAHGRGVIGSAEYSKSSAECEVCHRIFSEERLKFHMKLHDSLSLFTCDKCPKKFRSLATLEKHIMNNHLTEKKFTCATCGKSFGKLNVLKQHEEIHNPIKIYVQCEMCKTILLMKSFKLHMEIKHGNKYQEKKFVCECGKAFVYSRQLDKHQKAVHEKINRGMIYPCTVCDQAFNRRHELREHSFDHHSGKTFSCSCGMKFKSQKLLTTHSVIHKSLSWQCESCPMSFKTRGGRRKHQAKVHRKNLDELVELANY